MQAEGSASATTTVGGIGIETAEAYF